MRIFIAINLPPAVQKELARLQEDLARKHWPVRWEKPEKIHLTLAFLGNTKISLSRIKKAVLAGCRGIKSFEVSIKGLGAFPDFVRPRVVWVGLKGDLKNLAQLQKKISRELTAAKIDFKQKPFRPHLTIGRVKKGISKGALTDLGKKIRQHRKIDFKNTVRIDSVVIMKSDLRRTGSIHTKLAEINL